MYAHAQRDPSLICTLVVFPAILVLFCLFVSKMFKPPYTDDPGRSRSQGLGMKPLRIRLGLT